MTNLMKISADSDIHMAATQSGFTFSTPCVDDKSKFEGIPEHADCANRLNAFNGTCRDLKICTLHGTLDGQCVKENFPDAVITTCCSDQELKQNKILGVCNVVSFWSLSASEAIIRAIGHDGPFNMGHRSVDGEALALVTRQDDPKWSSTVNLMVNALFVAEADNITQENAQQVLLPLNHPDNAEMVSTTASIVTGVGNRQEADARNLESMFARQSHDQLCNKNQNQNQMTELEKSNTIVATATGLLFPFE